MTLYDQYGRAVFTYNLDFSLSDPRYVRRDINDSLTKNYDWLAVAGSNFRISGGKVQIKNEDTGLWHSLRCKNVDGIASYFPDDNPVV